MQHWFWVLPAIFFVYVIAFFALQKWQWLDRPNTRSSHQSVTLRGLGIAFLPIVVLAWMLQYLTGWQCIGILFAGFTGLAADFEWMPPLHRLLLYVIACILFLSGSSWFGYQGWWLPVLLVGLLIWINLFNFMDGVNGMMALNSLVSLVTYLLLPELKAFYGFIGLIIGLTTMYAFFNVRKKALAFAGDVGSIVLSICVALPMLLAISKSGNWWYLMFFCLYITDAGFTLLKRFFKGYNVLKPHRTHLYEYLANEAGKPHLKISIAYGAVQLGINICILLNVYFNWIPPAFLAVALGCFIFLGYYFYRSSIEKKFVALPING